jgi:hypothetical protein
MNIMVKIKEWVYSENKIMGHGKPPPQGTMYQKRTGND